MPSEMPEYAKAAFKRDDMSFELNKRWSTVEHPVNNSSHPVREHKMPDGMLSK